MIAYASRILIVDGPQGSPPAANVIGELIRFEIGHLYDDAKLKAKIN